MVSSGSISHLSAGFVLIWWYIQNTNSHSRWILIMYIFLRKKFMFRVKMKSKWYHSMFHVFNYERKDFNTGSVFQAFNLRKRISIAERKGRIVTFFIVHSLSWINLLSGAVRVWECNSLVVEFNFQFFQLCFEALISYISLCSFNNEGDFRTICSTFSTLLSFLHVLSRITKQWLKLHQCENNACR